MRPRSQGEAWLKYHSTPQRYPHKDLIDLGDNWISSLAGRAGRKSGLGEAFADSFAPFANNGTRTPGIFRPFLSSGRKAPRASQDLRGPSWRLGGAYGPRRLPPAMRRIARGTLLGPRANSRSWRGARSPRSYGRPQHGTRGLRDTLGRQASPDRPQRARPAGATTLGNPFDERYVPRCPNIYSTSHNEQTKKVARCTRPCENRQPAACGLTSF